MSKIEKVKRVEGETYYTPFDDTEKTYKAELPPKPTLKNTSNLNPTKTSQKDLSKSKENETTPSKNKSVWKKFLKIAIIAGAGVTIAILSAPHITGAIANNNEKEKTEQTTETKESTPLDLEMTTVENSDGSLTSEDINLSQSLKNKFGLEVSNEALKDWNVKDNLTSNSITLSKKGDAGLRITINEGAKSQINELFSNFEDLSGYDSVETKTLSTLYLKEARDGNRYFHGVLGENDNGLSDLNSNIQLDGNNEVDAIRIEFENSYAKDAESSIEDAKNLLENF